MTRRTKRPLTDAEKETAVRMYGQGYTIKEISVDLDRNRSTMREYLIACGVHKPQSNRLKDSNKREAVELYRRGLPLADIRARTGCSYDTIYRQLPKHGVPIRAPELSRTKPRDDEQPRDHLPQGDIAAADVRRLLIDVVAVAADDLNDYLHRDDALEFFGSRWYRHILTALDLPPNLLPKGVRLEAAH